LEYLNALLLLLDVAIYIHHVDIDAGIYLLSKNVVDKLQKSHGVNGPPPI
jgi:hypothetical protein